MTVVTVVISDHLNHCKLLNCLHQKWQSHVWLWLCSPPKLFFIRSTSATINEPFMQLHDYTKRKEQILSCIFILLIAILWIYCGQCVEHHHPTNSVCFWLQIVFITHVLHMYITLRQSQIFNKCKKKKNPSSPHNELLFAWVWLHPGAFVDAGRQQDQV